MSYNPSYKDHQALLFRAAVVEMNKEKEQNRIEYHTTRMFPKAGEAPTAESWLNEMSEGLKKADEAEDNPASEPEEEEVSSPGGAGASNKLKTRKQRRKAKELLAEKRRLQRLKANKLKNEDIYLLKAMKKNLKKEEAMLQGRLEKRRLKKQESMLTPALLSKHKFEEPEIDLKLSDELTGNLRSLKPEGNLLQDRFKSMQKRNVFEPTVKEKAKKQKKKLKRKIFERKSNKLPGHSQKK
jgi:nucleolar protein 53